MIRIIDTEIGYGEVLFRVEDLELQKGEIYALIGSNGRGKTTFLKTLNGVQPAFSGRIEIKGKDIRTFNEHEIACIMSYVTPRFEGVEHLTVFDLVLLGRTPYLPMNGKTGSRDRAIAMEIIKLAGLEHLTGKSTSRISDGERQLAAICRSLAQETDVIMLDEPTAFLDYPNKIKVIRLLKKVAKEQNKCIILSSHDIELCLQENLTMLALTTQKQLLRPISTSKQALVRSCFGIDDESQNND